MRQYHLERQPFRDSLLALFLLNGERNEMRSRFGELRRELAPHGDNSTSDRFLVALRYIPTAHHHVVHEQGRVWAESPWVLGLASSYACIDPGRLHYVYHVVKCAVVVGEVGRGRDDVSDLFKLLDVSGGVVEGYQGPTTSFYVFGQLCRTLAAMQELIDA